MHYQNGSVGDSILKIDDAIDKAKKLNIAALSITDHGSMSAVIEFYKQCIDNNIKPLIGLEAYECDDRTKKDKEHNTRYHLLLLAKNKQGYKDLLYILEDSNNIGFYEKPRTDISVLKDYGKNIIATSACLGGRIPKIIKKIYEAASEDEEEQFCDEAIELISEYKKIFADFYLEIQPGENQEQINLNNALIQLSEITNTKLILTNDIHYLNEEDWRAHDRHLKMKMGKKDSDPQIYKDKCYYIMDEDEIKKKLYYIEDSILEEAISNTAKIMNDIDLSNLYEGPIKMPKISIPDEYDENEYLVKITYEHASNLLLSFNDPSEYYSRIEYELDVLKEVGFSGYVLVVKDLIDHCNSKHIAIGPGRGSIAGSLVAYILGITKIDPIVYNLDFDRFISKKRKGSVPDYIIDSYVVNINY